MSKPLKPPAHVLHICQRLESSGFQAYIVGGAIRDLLRGIEPTDWDICTDALPAEVMSLFPAALPLGIAYGTVTVMVDGNPVEVTTMREDGAYSDGRRPDQVIFGRDLTKDLARRDFTINAIAYRPATDQYTDPFGGRRDLRRQIVRCVGDPKQRFQEDGLRVLRFFRFIATLDFKPDRATLKAVDPRWLRGVSAERTGDELSRLLVAPDPTSALQLMIEKGVLGELIPELTPCAQIPKGGHSRQSVLEHTIKVTGLIRPTLVLRLAALLHDIGKSKTLTYDEYGAHYYGHEHVGSEMAREILTRLRFSKKVVTQVAHLVRWHMFQVPPNATDRTLRRLIARTGRTAILDLLELRRADILGSEPRDIVAAQQYFQQLAAAIQQILQEGQTFTLKDLAISGHDLQRELGLKPGPMIGRVLNHLLEQTIDEPKLNEYRTLLALARQYVRTIEDRNQ